MFTITKEFNVNEFSQLFENHRVHISACNVFYQNIRMLNGRHTLLDRDTFVKYIKDLTDDIELVTSPIDAFMPADESIDKLFLVNRVGAEFDTIKERFSYDDILCTLPVDNSVTVALKNDRKLLEDVIDDIYIYFSLHRYLAQIDAIRLATFSNMTPVIEYVVKNVSKKDIKNHLVSRRINEEKYNSKCQDIIFNPDIRMVQSFYSTQKDFKTEDSSPNKLSVPVIDVQNLLMRLVTNTTIKSDIYVILGIYLTLSFAMTDFMNPKIETSPCTEYICNVLNEI